MTVLVVLRASRFDAARVVFEPSINTGGTLYTQTLTVNQSSTATLTAAPAINRVLTVSQQNEVFLFKSTTHTLSAAQASGNTVITDTTLLGALTTVGNASIGVLARMGQMAKSAGNAGLATVALLFQSGSGFSTYFKTLTTNATSSLSFTKGIQTIKTVRQPPGGSGPPASISLLYIPVNTILLTLSAGVAGIASLGKLVQNVRSVAQQSLATLDVSSTIHQFIQMTLSSVQRSMAAITKGILDIRLALGRNTPSVVLNVVSGGGNQILMTLSGNQASQAVLTLVANITPPPPPPTEGDPYYIARAQGRKFLAVSRGRKYISPGGNQ